MFAKITKAAGVAWWNKHIGEVFEVRLPTPSETLFTDTHYMLSGHRPMGHGAVAISRDCCVIIDGEHLTNKNAKHLLSKEE
jgi:hypothetical protein